MPSTVYSIGSNFSLLLPAQLNDRAGRRITKAAVVSVTFRMGDRTGAQLATGEEHVPPPFPAPASSCAALPKHVIVVEGRMTIFECQQVVRLWLEDDACREQRKQDIFLLLSTSASARPPVATWCRGEKHKQGCLELQ